jgi:hypothetical protein
LQKPYHPAALYIPALYTTTLYIKPVNNPPPFPQANHIYPFNIYLTNIYLTNIYLTNIYLTNIYLSIIYLSIIYLTTGKYELPGKRVPFWGWGRPDGKAESRKNSLVTPPTQPQFSELRVQSVDTQLFRVVFRSGVKI